ncbi:MarR family transcriptional regulator [Lapillicoccus jejuensis]|uniref:MarR family transcriptional regulator n=1 Tax=Lapillicoccus jejuensis TaxID=402171 RepID=UPI001B880016|nr:MarR family transcriptional regulator [Lapillicoccus jejuensis]
MGDDAQDSTPGGPLAAPGLLDVLTALRDLFAANESVRLEVARHLGISVNEIIALTHLQTHGPMTQRELADGLGLSPSAVTVMLDRLEPRGLMSRRRHPTDRRRTIVEVHTPADDPMGLYAVLARPFLAMDEGDRVEAARLLALVTEQVRLSAEHVGALPPVAPPRRRL